MKKLIRDNIVYIFFVLGIWAITFPLIFWGKDWIFSQVSYFWSPPGYNPSLTDKLIGTGDSYLVPQGKSFGTKFKEFLSADEEPALPPLDLSLMESACNYFENREHKDPYLDYPSWHTKKSMLKDHIQGEKRELILSFEPQYYWRENIQLVLSALDYYKRALNFSGAEIRVPKRIETASLAACRYSEILLAYTTHVYQTEEFVKQNYLKDELESENPLKKPSLFRRIWNWMRGREFQAKDLPMESKLTQKQIQLRVWDKIRSNQISEIKRSEFLESLTKTLENQGTSLIHSSPHEALEIYERLLFFVSNQNSPIEYRRFRKERADIYLSLAKEDSKFYKKSILEFRDASQLPNPDEIPREVYPALLVESFALELGIARVQFQEKKFLECLRTLQDLETKLRHLDERSAGGVGLSIEKENLLKEYRSIKKTTLRKLGRFEEADEIPST